MKLAEALTERADMSRRLQELRERIVRNAKYQDGDAPAEDPNVLLQEYERVSEAFRDIIVRINRTNNSITLESGVSMIEALATRDVLKLKHSMYKSLADEATIKQSRYSKSEIRFVSAVSVGDVQNSADTIAKTYRALDGQIQQANWTHDLI